MVRALASTGGVIICIGVLIDTLLVRTVMVPGLAVWLGERFWWPRSRLGSTTASAPTP